MAIGNEISYFLSVYSFPKLEMYISVHCELILSVKTVKQFDNVLATLKVLETRLPTVSFENS